MGLSLVLWAGLRSPGSRTCDVPGGQWVDQRCVALHRESLPLAEIAVCLVLTEFEIDQIRAKALAALQTMRVAQLGLAKLPKGRAAAPKRLRQLQSTTMPLPTPDDYFCKTGRSLNPTQTTSWIATFFATSEKNVSTICLLERWKHLRECALFS